MFLVNAWRVQYEARDWDHGMVPGSQAGLSIADGKLFAGPVEVDETYMGGKRRNMAMPSARLWPTRAGEWLVRLRW